MGQTRTSSLEAARPLPPSADIGPGGQSVGQAAKFCFSVRRSLHGERRDLRCDWWGQRQLHGVATRWLDSFSALLDPEAITSTRHREERSDAAIQGP